MLELLNDPNHNIFYWCIAIVMIIAAMELVCALLGGALSTVIDGALDLDIDIDIDGPNSPILAALGWMMFGKLPFMVVLIVFLTCFSVIGLTIQHTVFLVYGSYLPVFVASLIALFGSIPAQHYIGGKLARLIPKTESSAVRDDTFVGKTAVITTGTATVGRPAEALLSDEYGQQHYILIEPITDDMSFPRGSEVVITEKFGTNFRGVKP